MILKDNEGTKVGEFSFDSVKLGNFKANCLQFTEQAASGKTKTTVYRLSALKGFTLDLGNGKTIALNGEESQIMSQLKEFGIGYNNDNIISPTAVEKLKELDTDDPNHINVIVIISDKEDDQVELRFERSVKLPTIKDVKEALLDNERFVTATEEQQFLGLAEDVDGDILKDKYKIHEDKTIYCILNPVPVKVWEDEAPADEAPADVPPALTDDDFDAVDIDNTKFDDTETYYIKNATTGEYEPAEIKFFAEGVTYYTLKPVDEAPTVDPNT